jgi:hypothetical protein
MGLDFTSIGDKTGAALYFIHTPNTLEIESLTRLAEDIRQQTPHQVVLIDVNTPDGENIRDFYDIMPEQLPVALIVRDDDSVAQMWSGEEIPTTASDIAFQLDQTSTT